MFTKFSCQLNSFGVSSSENDWISGPQDNTVGEYKGLDSILLVSAVNPSLLGFC